MKTARMGQERKLVNCCTCTFFPTRKVLPLLCQLGVICALVMTLMYSHLQRDKEKFSHITKYEVIPTLLDHTEDHRPLLQLKLNESETTLRESTASSTQTMSTTNKRDIINNKVLHGITTPPLMQKSPEIRERESTTSLSPFLTVVQDSSEDVDAMNENATTPGDILIGEGSAEDRISPKDPQNLQSKDLNVTATIASNDVRQDSSIPLTTTAATGNDLSAKDAIHCVTSAMSDFFKKLEVYRDHMLPNATWRNWNPQGMVVVSAQAKGDYLARLSGYSNVQVFKVNIALTKLRQCFTSDFYYKYSISRGQCNEATKRFMLHMRNGFNLFNLSCTNSLAETLHPSTLSSVAFDIGLPLVYNLGSGGDMVSYLTVFQSGLVSSEGDVISGNVKHIIQRCFDDRFEKPVPLEGDPTEYPLYEEVFSMGVMWGGAFYHSNIDALGRLVAFLPFLRKHQNIKIHLTRWPKFAAVFLSSEGLSADRFVHGVVRAKLLYVPAGFPCHRPPFFPVHLMGLYMRANLPNGAASRDTVILIYRTPQNKSGLQPRHFKNHDAIMATLKGLTDKLNLNFWEFRDDPVPDTNQTAHMFNRALVVIAPHGAGEANLVFTQPGTVLIEGLCMRVAESTAFSMAFRNLVHTQGGIYHGIYNAKHQCEETTPQEILEPVMFFLEAFQTRKLPSQ